MKTYKTNITIEFFIFKLVWVSNFILNNFRFLDHIYPEQVFLIKTRKSDYLHWILNIQISWSTKFQFKLTILIYWTKFAKKEHFGWKQRKWTSPLSSACSLTISIFGTKFPQKWHFWLKIEKVNITMEFCIFKLVKVPNFSLNWKFWLSRPNLHKTRISSWNWKKQTSPLNSTSLN